MRKPYRERAVLKARQEADDYEAAYKSERWLCIQLGITIFLSASYTIFFLWQWLVQGKTLDFSPRFTLTAMLCVLPMYAFMLWAKLDMLAEGKSGKEAARQRLAAAQKKLSGSNETCNERGVQ